MLEPASRPARLGPPATDKDSAFAQRQAARTALCCQNGPGNVGTSRTRATTTRRAAPAGCSAMSALARRHASYGICQGNCGTTPRRVGRTASTCCGGVRQDRICRCNPNAGCNPGTCCGARTRVPANNPGPAERNEHVPSVLPDSVGLLRGVRVSSIQLCRVDRLCVRRCRLHSCGTGPGQPKCCRPG